MQKVLIVQTAFIGDVVLATPVIESLNKHNSAFQIDFLLRKGNEGLFKEHPYINELLIWNKKEGKYKALANLIKKIRKRKYDIVINIQRFGATGILTALSGAKIKIGFKSNPFSFCFTHKIEHSVSKGMHETERNLQLLAPLFIRKDIKPALYPTVQNEHHIATYIEEKYICAAPTSVWFTKQFPAEKWVELFNSIPSDYVIYLLGGPDDHEDCQAIQNASTHPKIKNLAGLLNMLESVALMQKAKMNYVNDSAPMHMASAVNAPTTAIFCSTVPSFGFGPLSDNSSIVQVNSELKCRPCGLHGHKKCPENHFKCGYEIKKQDLLARVL